MAIKTPMAPSAFVPEFALTTASTTCSEEIDTKIKTVHPTNPGKIALNDDVIETPTEPLIPKQEFVITNRGNSPDDSIGNSCLNNKARNSGTVTRSKDIQFSDTVGPANLEVITREAVANMLDGMRYECKINGYDTCSMGNGTGGHGLITDTAKQKNNSLDIVPGPNREIIAEILPNPNLPPETLSDKCVNDATETDVSSINGKHLAEPTMRVITTLGESYGPFRAPSITF